MVAFDLGWRGSLRFGWHGSLWFCVGVRAFGFGLAWKLLYLGRRGSHWIWLVWKPLSLVGVEAFGLGGVKAFDLDGVEAFGLDGVEAFILGWRESLWFWVGMKAFGFGWRGSLWFRVAWKPLTWVGMKAL